MEISQNLLILLSILACSSAEGENSTKTYLPLIDSLDLHILDLDNESPSNKNESDYFEQGSLFNQFDERFDEVPGTYLKEDQETVFPTERPSVQTRELTEEIPCNKVRCFIVRKNNEKYVDCLESHPENFVSNLVCNYIIKPIDQTYNSQSRDVKVFIKTEYDDANIRHREELVGIVDGALDRLFTGIKVEIHSALKQTPEIRLGLAISFIRFAKIDKKDFINLILNRNLVALSLWNPTEMAQDSFLPNSQEDLEKLNNIYFRLKIYCETNNSLSAFNRLWLPFKMWSINLDYCSDLFVCRVWPQSEVLCFDEDRGKRIQPNYVLSTKVKSSGDSFNSHMLKQKPVNKQTFSNGECMVSPQPNDSFDNLKLDNMNQCWHETKDQEETPTTTKALSLEPDTETAEGQSDVSTESIAEEMAVSSNASRTQAVEADKMNQYKVPHGFNYTLPDIIKGNSTNQTLPVAETQMTKGLIFAVIGLGVLNFLILLCLICLFLWFSKFMKHREYKKQPPFPSRYDLPTLPKRLPSKDVYNKTSESFNSDSSNVNSELGLRINNPALSQLTCNTAINSNNNSPLVTPKARSLFMKNNEKSGNYDSNSFEGCQQTFSSNETKKMFENPEMSKAES